MEESNFGLNLKNLGNTLSPDETESLKANNSLGKNLDKEKYNNTNINKSFLSRKFIGIKFPGKIENLEKALKSIGGFEEIKKNVRNFIINSIINP